MKRLSLILICSVLTVQSAICQTAYPKKAVIDGDTVCILNSEQTKAVNKVFVDRDECFELRDSLYSQIKNYDILVSDKNSVITSQQTEIDICKKIISDKDIIIQSSNKQLKDQNNKIKFLKIQRTFFWAIPAIGAGIIAYMHMTHAF